MDDDMIAHGYTLRIYIAKSHLPRKAEIIEQVLAILEDFEANRSE